ncbi:MAG TPA: hypothetical protein VN256_03450 [Pyrinomonadaceae bacterium]|nr:hypothetical protein [Pyrinomonadaceae bacterium]
MVAHRTILGGVGPNGLTHPPTILQRADQEFIAGILDELAGADGVPTATQKTAQARDADGVLRLFQPAQRTFHVALLQMVCDLNGLRPRLDPARIESAGLIVRRVAVDRDGRDVFDRRGERVLEGWVSSGKSLRGWQPLTLPGQLKFDPDPARRPPALSAGNPEIDRLLHLSRRQIFSEQVAAEQWAESTSALFVAPPEVCSATKRTILYGLIPVTSNELSEAPPRAASFDKNDADIRAHLSGYLKSGVNTSLSGLSRKRISYAMVNDPALPVTNPAMSERLGGFLLLLRQLAFEFNAFGDTAEAVNLYRKLNSIELTILDVPETGQATTYTRQAGDFLKEAKEVLIEGVGRPDRTVLMPYVWPTISAQTGEELWDAITPAMNARLAAIMPKEGRFDNPARTYQLWAFARVKRDDGCPPELVWGGPSEFFKIVPWYESNRDIPPVQVTLPDPLQKGFLDGVKPNVSFVVPSGLFNLLQANDPKKMSDGEGQEPPSGGLALDWICGFNIPVITICAFIVLNIFLQLFNIIFRWLMFIKICIPIPKGLLPKGNP